jgi:hypothetical protein
VCERAREREREQMRERETMCERKSVWQKEREPARARASETVGGTPGVQVIPSPQRAQAILIPVSVCDGSPGGGGVSTAAIIGAVVGAVAGPTPHHTYIYRERERDRER